MTATEDFSAHTVPEVETAVLAACMFDRDAATYALQKLRLDHFTSGPNRQLLKAIQVVTAEGGLPDVPAVIAQMMDQGLTHAEARSRVIAVGDQFVTAANQQFHVKVLLHKYLERVEHEVSEAIASNGHTGAMQLTLRQRADRAREEVERLLAPAPSLSAWDLTDLTEEGDDPPPDEFVSRLFVRPSFNIVFGPPQAGKSWAVMALCLDAVLGGGNFLGCEDLYIKPLREIRDGKNERVLWVFGSEDTRARVKRRLKTLLKSGPQSDIAIPRGAFTIATPPGGLSISMPEGWRWLTELIEKVQPTIVVLDTIASLTASSLDVNKAEQVVPFIAQINALRAEKNLIIFALHHTRKGSSDGKKSSGVQADAMLGAGAWRALSEGVLMLDAPDGDTSKVTVLSVKAKDIDRPIPKLFVSLESPGGRFRQLDEDEQPAPREAVQKGGRPPKFSAEAILALREKSPSGIPWTCDSICKLLDIGKSQWFERREIVFQALSDAGCAVIQGTLKWHSGN